MTEKNISAFPHYTANASNWQFGMTMRDWFAGQVVASTIGGLSSAQVETDESHIPLVAKMAYMVADAMMEARK